MSSVIILGGEDAHAIPTHDVAEADARRKSICVNHHQRHKSRFTLKDWTEDDNATNTTTNHSVSTNTTSFSLKNAEGLIHRPSLEQNSSMISVSSSSSLSSSCASRPSRTNTKHLLSSCLTSDLAAAEERKRIHFQRALEEIRFFSPLSPYITSSAVLLSRKLHTPAPIMDVHGENCFAVYQGRTGVVHVVMMETAKDDDKQEATVEGLSPRKLVSAVSSPALVRTLRVEEQRVEPMLIKSFINVRRFSELAQQTSHKNNNNNNNNNNSSCGQHKNHNNGLQSSRSQSKNITIPESEISKPLPCSSLEKLSVPETGWFNLSTSDVPRSMYVPVKDKKSPSKVDVWTMMPFNSKPATPGRWRLRPIDDCEKNSVRPLRMERVGSKWYALTDLRHAEINCHSRWVPDWNAISSLKSKNTLLMF